MANATFEEVLDKLSFTSVNSKDFLEILFETDEKGVDYLSSLKKEFKEKYVIPTFDKAKKVYTDIGKGLKRVEDNKDVLHALEDPLNITELNKEYKEKAKEIFEKRLKQIDSAKVVDLNLKEPNLGNKLSTTEAFKTSLSNLSPTVSAKVNQNQTAQEQATFNAKPQIFSLSDDTIDKIKEIFDSVKPTNVNVAVEKEKGGFDWLKLIGGLLAAGGIATLLITAFWDDKIKPWLEDKFNFKLDFLDKFEGAAEGLAKFFTLGGLKITAGPLFTLVGKAVTTLGDLVEGALSAIFKLGFGDEVVQAGAKAAPAAWKTILPKIAGGLLKTVGLVTLKGIPVIGALLSFYFAYDRFQKSDYIGAVIDIVGGLSNLLAFTPLAPLAIPLSLGAAALNAFLDYQTGDLPEDQKNSGKLNILGDLSSKLYNMVKDIPIIGGLFNFGLGIYELASGNFAKGLDYLVDQPFLGPLPAILKSIMDSTEEQPDGTKTFSFDKFKTEIKKNMFKLAKSLVPDWFGLHGKIASWMGIDYNSTTGEMSEAELNVDSINQAQQERQQQAVQKFAGLNPQIAATDEKEREKISTAYKQAKDELAKIEQEYKESWSSMSVFGANVGNLLGTDIQEKLEAKKQEMIEITKKMKEMMESSKKEEFAAMGPEEANEQYDKAKDKFDDVVRAVADQYAERKPPIKVQDFYKPADGQSTLLMTKNQTIQTDPSDDILALKSDGILDKGFKQLSGLMESMNRGIYKMSTDMKNLPQQSSPSVSVASNANKSNMNEVVLSGGRDTIYELRTLWWRRATNFREFN